jgi:Protein of unknown function (DUF3987)
VEHTEFIESPVLFRKWVGISTIAAMLERKVWVNTGQVLFPNLYVILVGPSGIGKTRPIVESLRMLRQVPDFHLSPTSMTKASLVDCIEESKRDHFTMGPEGRTVQCWNSLFIAVDELSAFMSKWEHELAAALTKFWDCDEYAETRRIGKIRIKIENPQVNILCGTTPAQLMDLIPTMVWGQGLMSRTILVYSDNKIIKNILGQKEHSQPDDLLHDLLILSSIQGGAIAYDQEFDDMLHTWRLNKKQPAPTNPRLTDYCSRRDTHLLKLAMVACVDWGDQFVLTKKHFDRAMTWLLEAEANMSAIFNEGSTIDSRNLDDVIDWMAKKGRPIPKHELYLQVARAFPAHMVKSAIEILQQSGRIEKDAIGDWHLIPRQAAEDSDT